MDAVVNGGTFPASSFINRGIPPAPYDVFCSSQLNLADGRVAIIGGHQSARAEIGSSKVAIFDPGNLASPWQLPDSMTYHRWYPTSTMLPDGKVLTLSGTQYAHWDVFGGYDAAGSSSDWLRRDPTLFTAGWDPEVQPSNPPSKPDGPDGLSMVPGDGTGAFEIVFGGRSGSTYSKKLSLLYRDANQSGPDYQYTWQVPQQTIPRPAVRAFHAAVKVDQGHMVIIGGSNGTSVLNDIWDGGYNSSGTWVWTPVSATSSDSLGPRYAHEAVYVPTLKRIFVFGGTSSIGSGSDPVDAEVWSMSTDPPLSQGFTRWIRCTSQGSLRPSARIQHSFTLDDVAWKNATEGNRYRAFLYVRVSHFSEGG